MARKPSTTTPKPKRRKAAKKPTVRRARKGAVVAPVDDFAAQTGQPEWDHRFVKIAEQLVQRGATDEDVADALGCDMEAIAWWREEYPGFDKAFYRDHKGPGRPTEWDEKFVQIARKACEMGATDMDLAQMFAINVRTIHRWKLEHPEFADALEIGKDRANENVKLALYKRATGYTYDAEKIVTVGGLVQRIEVIEHVPPDTKAAETWLYNRDPENWKKVVKINHDADKGGALERFLDRVGGTSFAPEEPDEDG
jgi:hypothetical protein